MPFVLKNAVVIGDELALSFADDVEVYLPITALRRACPCAVCQGEPDALGRVVRPKVQLGPKAFELKKIDTVGGYALQLSWADGHGSGIYTFEYLRKLAAPLAP